MSPARRRRWYDRLRIVGPYLVVVFVFAGGVWALSGETHQRCIDRQTDREVLRQVVDISTSAPPSVQVDLTKVPGFADLDVRTQTFIDNLAAALAAASPTNRSVLHDRLLTQLPPIECH